MSEGQVQVHKIRRYSLLPLDNIQFRLLLQMLMDQIEIKTNYINVIPYHTVFLPIQQEQVQVIILLSCN